MRRVVVAAAVLGWSHAIAGAGWSKTFAGATGRVTRITVEMNARTAAPDKQTQLRKDKLVEYNAQLERGMPTMVSQCQAAHNTDTIDCMIAAKTADQAKACEK